MVKKHIKRLTAPITWPIKRKENKFTTRPNPGKKMDMSLPIVLIFKNMLRYCKTTKEVKRLLLDNEVLVDGKRRKDVKYPVGLMDVLSIPSSEEYYRLIINSKSKLVLIPITKKESESKICKVEGKTIKKGGEIQLNLHDGRNLSVKQDKYKVGDSLLISLPVQKIVEHFEFKEKNYAFLKSGSYTGQHGTIEKIEPGKKGMVTIKTSTSKVMTNKQAVIVVGKIKQAIKLSGEK